MRETVMCKVADYNQEVADRTAFGWNLVLREEYRTTDNVLTNYRLTFELDESNPNKETLMGLYNQYKVQQTVKKPHTVASFVWGSLLFWISSLLFYILSIGDAEMLTDPEYAGTTFFVFGTPWVIGLFMIVMGIVFRVKYVKKLEQVKQDRQMLLQQAKLISQSAPLISQGEN